MNRDPRYRARLNQISSTIESANLTTQASLWSLKESYLGPCLTSVSTCLEAACHPCIGERRERARARQRRFAATARGRPEFVFDFYNDEWDFEEEGEDERTGLLGAWGADELDRLLAGSGSGGNAEGVADNRLGPGGQPKRRPGMNYGATNAGGLAQRRRSTLLAVQGSDPTILPGSSMFGFLERLPWKIGGRGVKYKPSAADLQENLGGKKRKGGHGHKDSKGDIDQETGTSEETSALLEDDEHSDSDTSYHNHKQKQSHRRNRSDTTTSRSTQNSLSSRGDLFPSEDEAADAVPLDDSFALSFAHRSSDGEHDSHSHTAADETTDPDSNSQSQGKSTKSPSSHRPRKTTLNRQRSERSSNTSSRAEPSNKPKSANANTRPPTGPMRKSHTSSRTTSEMALHSPLSPITPSGGSDSGSHSLSHSRSRLGGSSRSASEQDLTHSLAWSVIHSDHENEADVSALVSPVAERGDVLASAGGALVPLDDLTVGNDDDAAAAAVAGDGGDNVEAIMPPRLGESTNLDAHADDKGS